MALTKEEERIAKVYIKSAIQKRVGDEASSRISLKEMGKLAKEAKLFLPQLIQRIHSAENKDALERLKALVEANLSA